MNTSQLSKHFAECLLPVEFVNTMPGRPVPSEITDVGDLGFITVQPPRLPDQRFQIVVTPGAEMSVLDKNPQRRHLLALIRHEPAEGGAAIKQHYVLGHDERQLFVVGVEPSVGLADALTSLKPRGVMRAERRGLRVIRQGDWFFVPLTGQQPDPNLVGIFYANEPIGGPAGSRYGLRIGNPHIAEEQRVMIGDAMRYMQNGWTKVGREIQLILVRGKIRHAEHATIELRDWHQTFQTQSILSNSIGYWD